METPKPSSHFAKTKTETKMKGKENQNHLSKQIQRIQTLN